MSNNSHFSQNISQRQSRKLSQTAASSAITETYLSHPVFGLLNNLCIVDNQSALFTSLYANRLFFLVTSSVNGLMMDSVSRDEARFILEKRLAILRKSSFHQDYEQLRGVYKSTFNR